MKLRNSFSAKHIVLYTYLTLSQGKPKIVLNVRLGGSNRKTVNLVNESF
jgi:hypothetical protein